MPSTSPCTLREDPKNGRKGVHSQEAAVGNTYNHNFRNRFCGCGEQYDPYQEKGTMFQCLGLGTVETGGCGEDWWHPECLIGLPRDWHKSGERKQASSGGVGQPQIDDDDETPLPPGFPAEDDFWQLICYKCLGSNAWLKQYAGTPGFLPPVFRNGGLKKASVSDQWTKITKSEGQAENWKKRKADDDEPSQEPTTKRAKEGEKASEESIHSQLATIKEEEPPKPDEQNSTSEANVTKPKHTSLPTSTPAESFSLFVEQDFHTRLCRCAECYPKLAPHPQLREEEDTYEPPLSDDGEHDGAGSTGTGSILERGEAALSNVDRVRAIEGAMIYNHLRDKVKDFLKPFAESGQAVSAEDIKGYFEKLRGDEQGIQDAAGQAEAMGSGGGGDNDGDNRREQGGKCNSRCYVDNLMLMRIFAGY